MSPDEHRVLMGETVGAACGSRIEMIGWLGYVLCECLLWGRCSHLEGGPMGESSWILSKAM